MPLGRLTTHDLDILRLLFRGGSVVDWFRLHMDDPTEVDAFIKVNELDLSHQPDRERLQLLHQRSITYLQEHLHFRVPLEVAKIDKVENLFAYASGKGRRIHRFHACIALKVMHILHYVEAHELLSLLPISGAEVAVLLRAKVERVVRGLLERNFPIVDFTGNTKHHYSVLSKLLAKKNTQAAQVFDKLRFRLVVERLEDIPSLLVALMRELVPFNYLVPNQSDNSLVDLGTMLTQAGNLAAIRAQASTAHQLNEPPETQLGADHKNEFSGPSYRVVNFVCEVPIRIDKVLPIRSPRLLDLGPVVFGSVEFQIVDRLRAKSNESGENRHTLYKQRQRRRVKDRLERGKRRKHLEENTEE